MAILQLFGQGTFIVASLVLGTRLLLLWRRTKEVPELTIGLAFLVGGGIGYLAWFAMAIAAMKGAGPGTLHAITSAGLGLSCVGALFNGVGVARIFRPGTRWPVAFLLAIGAVMAGGWGVHLGKEALGSSSFWVAMLACAPVYAWAGIEAYGLARTLGKRARIGLADPVVVNRLNQWSASSAAVVLMIAVSFVSRLLYGPLLPPWVSFANAVLGLVAATTIWLGFFPPRALVRRLTEAYAS
ncbi:MAG: hypothetical protein ACQGVC_24340 [Myxococcota bacterium]